MADGSTKVVVAALIGNVLVAASKYAAAAVSGSSAMLTEAVHSTADGLNQMLLLVGTWRSKRRADASHVFGYGMEIYFWTFVVAVIVFLGGGVVSIRHGIAQLRDPQPIESPWLSVGVLVAAAVFEGSSLLVGIREYKRVVARHPWGAQSVTLWRFIALSKDPNLYETLVEDSAALAGIAVAALGVAGSGFAGIAWADGAASLGIGALLIGMSIVVAEATRSLIAGEGVAPGLLRDLRKAIDGHAGDVALSELRTLHLGPQRVLVALTVAPRERQQAATLRQSLDAVTASLRAVDPRIADVYFRLREEKG